MTKYDYKFTDQFQIRIVNSTKQAAEKKLNLFFERMNQIAYEFGI